MKNWVTAAMAALMTIAISPVNAQSSMPQMGAAESWGCQMNEGKSTKDLMKVVDDWNDWADDNDLNNYSRYLNIPVHALLVSEAGLVDPRSQSPHEAMLGAPHRRHVSTAWPTASVQYNFARQQVSQ